MIILSTSQDFPIQNFAALAATLLTAQAFLSSFCTSRDSQCKPSFSQTCGGTAGEEGTVIYNNISQPSGECTYYLCWWPQIYYRLGNFIIKYFHRCPTTTKIKNKKKFS